MNNKDYHKLIFLAIDKEEWENIMNDINFPTECKQLLEKAREEYKNRNINKKWSSKVATKTRVNKAFKKCAVALFYMRNNLFNGNETITPYRLMKEAKVHYNTAKKFLEKYKNEIELGEIEEILKELKIDISKL